MFTSPVVDSCNRPHVHSWFHIAFAYFSYWELHSLIPSQASRELQFRFKSFCNELETTETSFVLRSWKSKFPDTEWFIVSHDGSSLQLKRRFINLFIAPQTHEVVSAKSSVARWRNVNGPSRERNWRTGPGWRILSKILPVNCIQTISKHD